MAIDITGANAYFGATVHARSEAWTQFPLAKRIAAIAHAISLIENRFNIELDTATTVVRDFPRDDAAVYEQALWMLETLARDDKINDRIMNDTTQGGSLAANMRALKSPGYTLAPEARDFLVLYPGLVTLSRG